MCPNEHGHKCREYDFKLDEHHSSHSPLADKNFDDEDSVDGGRSSSSASSSKAPPSGRRAVAAASVRRPSSATGPGKISAKDAAAGAVDEEDFIKAFEEVPTIQVTCTDRGSVCVFTV